MLRSPFEALQTHRWQTAGVVLTLAATLWMTAATAAVVVQFEAASEGWFESFVPAVYLEGDVDDERAESLGGEIREWSRIRTVDIEGPDVALDRLEKQLGAREVREMGLGEEMMPRRLVVEPALWSVGTADLLARIEALEERDYVVAVDVPSSRITEWFDRGRVVFLGGGLAVIVALFGSLSGLVVLLRRLQERERRENHLLEVFGASGRSLRLATVWRGLFVGAVAGVVAGVGFVAWSLTLDGFVVELAGGSAMSPARCLLWASVLVASGVAVGAGIGWLFGRPTDAGKTDEMESLLDWQRETK